MWHRPLRLRHLFTSASPAMSILLTLEIIRLNAPAMFRGMVAVPAIQVRWERAAVFIYLIGAFPLFLIALLAALSKRRSWN